MSNQELFTQIAKKHMHIETLETRNSDSLDFHDVAVWSIEAALQEAYRAGVKKGISGELDFRGVIEVAYKDIVEFWGEPKKDDGYKTEACWIFLHGNEKIEIYNFKNSKSYDSSNPPIEQVREWSVNGNGDDPVATLLRMMPWAKLVSKV